MLIRFIKVLLIIIGLSAFGYSQIAADSKAGIVEGTANIFIRGNWKDIAVMPGIELSFKNEASEWKTVTNPDGQFLLNLPKHQDKNYEIK